MGIFDFLRSSQPSSNVLPQNCLLNYKRLNSIFQSSSQKYREAEPFPHIVIDDFLDKDIAELVMKEFPSIDSTIWSARDAKSHLGLDAQKLKWDYSLGRKYLDYEMSLHPVIRYLLLEINSNTFLRGLRTLTGIPGLISDPKMEGGGLHQTKKGGMLRIHADFQKHPNYQLDRRLNFLLFLNPHWENKWHGELELWPSDMKEKAVSILPIANRCVIFTTSRHSYHGYTQPLECPDSITRQSMAMYYYTVPNLDGTRKQSETYWQELPGEA